MISIISLKRSICNELKKSFQKGRHHIYKVIDKYIRKDDLGLKMLEVAKIRKFTYTFIIFLSWKTHWKTYEIHIDETGWDDGLWIILGIFHNTMVSNVVDFRHCFSLLFVYHFLNEFEQIIKINENALFCVICTCDKTQRLLIKITLNTK